MDVVTDVVVVAAADVVVATAATAKTTKVSALGVACSCDI